MIETPVASRVKLKNHVYFGIVPDGVLFDAGDASFVLKERSAYPIVEKLIALLDAGTPVEHILERAPTKLADFFRKILALLEQHGMLSTVEQDAPPAHGLHVHSAPNEMRKFLEDRLDGRAVDAALRRWRDAQVTVAGSGRALLAALRALADSGCTRLTVVHDGGASDGLAALCDEIAGVHGVRVASRTGFDEAPPHERAAMLLYVSDHAVPALVERIERTMRTAAVAGAIGTVFGGRACVMPAARPGHPGVRDLLHWLPPQDDAAASLGPVALALLGCVAAHAAMCRFFGVDAAAVSAQVAIVAPSLEVEYSLLVGAATGERAPVAMRHPSRFELPEWRPVLPFEQVRNALDPWFDPVLGPFSVVADDDIVQVPLLQYPIRVRPASAAAAPQVVIGWGLEHAAAVIRGLALAIEALAQSFGGDSQALVCEFDERSWQRRALACAVARSDEMARHHRWAWVDLEQLPPGPAQMLRSLLRFHAPEGVRVQLQWCEAGDAVVVRVLRADALISIAVAAEPLVALTEGLGQACSMLQLQQVDGLRFGPPADVRAPDAAARVDDWRAALNAAQTAASRPVEYHLMTTPGFPSAVFCGHASLPGMGAAR